MVVEGFLALEPVGCLLELFGCAVELTFGFLGLDFGEGECSFEFLELEVGVERD